MNYYTATFIVTCLMNLSMLFLIWGNKRLKSSKRGYFTIGFVLLTALFICEWAGVLIDGSGVSLWHLHVIVKALEICITPFIFTILVMAINKTKRNNILLGFCIVNAVFQFVASHFDVVFYIDSNNVYHHAKYYFLYPASYLICILFCFIEFTVFSKKYQNRNLLSLIAICIFTVLGVSIHEFYPDIYIDWLCGSIAYVLVYIYYVTLVEQMDSLTKLLDRKSFDILAQTLRKSAVFIVMDIDDFKYINDKFGHDKGDECLFIISKAIKHSYRKYGLCFRIGGDEFCVVIKKKKINANELNRDFEKRLCDEAKKHSNLVIPTVSIGYALYQDNINSIEQTISVADDMMYENKRIRKMSVKNKANDKEEIPY